MAQENQRLQRGLAKVKTEHDPLNKAPVYDEMARSVLNRFQSQNLAVRAAARIRSRA